MDKIYQWLKKSVSVSAINVIAEGVTCVIPKPTTYVIPEGRSRESHRCETAKRLRPPAKALGGDGICAKRLGLRAKPLGNDGARKRMLCAGFTLIELLVVVLIIGILSAVALPQYETSVMKSKMSALLPLMRAVKEANERYYLENGEYADDLSLLDIQIPPGDVYYNPSVGWACYGNGTCLDNLYDLNKDEYAVVGGLARSPEDTEHTCFISMYYDHSSHPGSIVCGEHRSAHPKCSRLCKSLGY